MNDCVGFLSAQKNPFTELNCNEQAAVNGGSDPYRVNHPKLTSTPESRKAAVSYTLGMISLCLGGADCAVVGAVTILGGSSMAVGAFGTLYSCV